MSAPPACVLDPTEALLVRLARVRPAAEVGPGDLAGVDLDRLLLQGARLSNFNQLARRLLSGRAPLPAAVRDRLARNLAHSDLRERLGLADLRELARGLADRGEPLLLLKGAAYTRFIYPEPGSRTFVDFDFLVRRPAAAPALALARALGYEPSHSIEGSIDLVRAVGASRLRVALELHTELVHHHDYPYYRADLALSEERLIARAESRDLDGVPVLVLRAADELLYSVLHFFFHHDMQGLKYHSDLNALLTDPRRPLDTGEALQVAEQARAGPAVGLVLLIHERIFGPGAVPAELLARLRPGRLRLAALERFLPPLDRLPVTEKRASHHAVKVLVAPGLRGPLGLGLRWLFPGRRYLMSFYGLAPAAWRRAYHLRYPASILRKGVERALRSSGA